MEKVVLVKSHFIPIGKEVTVKVPTGDTKTGFFGVEKEVYRKETRWEQTGYSDSIIDDWGLEPLAADQRGLSPDLLHVNTHSYRREKDRRHGRA